MAAGKPLTPWFGHDRTLAQQMMGLDRLFAQVEGKTVLDVGCAEGLLSIECAKSGAAFVRGVEIREQAVKDAASRWQDNSNFIYDRHVRFVLGDANVYTPTQDYDIVLLLAVLHKLKNPTAACARIVASATDLVVIRLPPEHAPTIIDERSGSEPHHIGDVMLKAGFDLELATNDGPFGEWVGYYRRRK
jgi:SAM-dependent methyltransferase